MVFYKKIATQKQNYVHNTGNVQNPPSNLWEPFTELNQGFRITMIVKKK